MIRLEEEEEQRGEGKTNEFGPRRYLSSSTYRANSSFGNHEILAFILHKLLNHCCIELARTVQSMVDNTFFDDDDEYDLGDGIDDEHLLAISIDAETVSTTTFAPAPAPSTCTTTAISGGHHAVAAPAAPAAPAGPVPNVAAPTAPAAVASPPEVYRFTFGKYRGQSIHEVPPQYIRWIINTGIHNQMSGLKEALESHNTNYNPTEEKPPTTSSTSSPPPPPFSPPSPPPPTSSNIQHEKSPYRLNFGKYVNKPLNEVPLTYIRFLTKQRAHESRPDLLGALTELAYTTDEERTALLLNQTTSPCPSSSSSRTKAKSRVLRKGSPSSSPSLSSTKKKAAGTMKRRRKFFDSFTGEPLWITNRDAYKFFNVTESDLRSAGLRPMGGGGGSHRWDLFDVYSHQVPLSRLRHSSSDSLDQSLDRFLQKNSDREEEIFAMLGLG